MRGESGSEVTVGMVLWLESTQGEDIACPPRPLWMLVSLLSAALASLA